MFRGLSGAMLRRASIIAVGLGLVGCYRGVGHDVDGGAGSSAEGAATEGEGSSAGESGGDDDPSEACAGVGAGLAPIRRLTDVQYRNTVRDLFGGAVEPGASFPAPQIHEEYTNNPAANVVSLDSARDILEAAEDAAAQVIDDIDAIAPCDGDEHACAEAFVDDFGRRAFRRPLLANEREALMAIYADADSHADGIGTVVATVLQSPQFLYLVEEGELHLRIDVAAHRDHDVQLRPSERAHRRTHLTIEVREIEGVEIREVEPADAEARERQEVHASDASETGDGDALAPQRSLLARRHPPEVARESRVVVERHGLRRLHGG